MVGQAVMSTPAGKAAAPGVKATTDATPTTKGGAAAGATNAPAAGTVTTMATGYKATTATPPPKTDMPATVKDVNSKVDSQTANITKELQNSNKFGPEMLEVLRAQITKQDEMLAIMQENLDINQRLLTNAQG